jgi:MFS transporter, SP family, xylose:H+ symportor
MVHGPASIREVPEEAQGDLHLGYLWLIALTAALGGLLFGYDWVVIGGAKPFYEAYFHLHSERLVGWANSCALIGCFLGAVTAGPSSGRFGRRPVLVAAALLFTVSSLLTGWSHHFAEFIAWRIAGGVAIGLASNVSPMYIAEISPAAWRGRLVSLNQLGIVLGILFAQIANWMIARKIPADITASAMAASWNAQYGWRWMFTAVAVPGLLFLFSAPFLPESPRWLVEKSKDAQAADVLRRIGGEQYSRRVVASIRKSMDSARSAGTWRELLAPSTRKLVLVGMALAVLQQGSGINILFNYAEEVYRSAGYGLDAILFNIVVTGAINLLFTLVAMFLVDRFGRRRLMIFGCVAIAACDIAASFAYRAHLHGFWVLAMTFCAIACYAMTLAPVTWVLITEIFPNRVRAYAVSAAVAALWVSSFLLTYTFPFLNQWLGTGGTFLIYAGICLAGVALVAFGVPESQGRSLEEMDPSL